MNLRDAWFPVVTILFWAVFLAAPTVKGQSVECRLSRSSSGLITGQCNGIPAPPSESDPNPVAIELRPEDGDQRVWAGTMEINNTDYDLEIASREFSDGTEEVIRTPFGWFLPSKLDLKGNPPELAWSLEEEAPPSRTDLKILKRARELISNEKAWDRADDRECSPSDTTYSLYCALAEATRIVTGDYRHRQPALQVVRRVVAENWPERIDNHRLMNFNNSSSTTHDDLIQAFDLAEERLLRSVR